MIYYNIVILNMLRGLIFQFFRWIDYKNERTQKWTFVLLLMQIYPQYRILDFLRYKSPNHKEWQRKVKEWEEGIGLLEPYLESILQVIIFHSNIEYYT